ncbi:hypothetical protein [Flagellimonas iocasae]|uniref:Uncharacterized protein n=1 Tax=Flagellimonas iocasae TaxID=2055905 RepID=A0ABW4Y1Z6_9FLAO
MENNIFIKALELGSKHPNGILYANLKEGISEVLDEELNRHAEFNFLQWLVENFSNPALPSQSGRNTFFNDAKAVLSGRKVDSGYQIRYDEVMHSPFILKGSAIKQYVDYIELKESREQAFKANRTAIISIVIAMITLLASVIIPLFDEPPPIPPFDVKVIESKVQSQKLENEIKKLKNELKKAELTISIYESDTMKN